MIDTEKIPLTEADTASYDSTAQILKAAMAYVNPSIGRMMAVMAKSIELRHMMQYFLLIIFRHFPEDARRAKFCISPMCMTVPMWHCILKRLLIQ